VRAHAIEIIDAVLQVEHHGVGTQIRRERPCRRFGTGRFHAEQHEGGIARTGRLGCRGGEADALRMAQAVEEQSVRNRGKFPGKGGVKDSKM
jgi:hypothetical protein